MAQKPKKQRLLLALLGGMMVLFGVGVAAFMLVAGIVTAAQGKEVDWVPLGIGIVVTGVIGLVGVWVVRRSGVPLGDAINF